MTEERGSSCSPSEEELRRALDAALARPVDQRLAAAAWTVSRLKAAIEQGSTFREFINTDMEPSDGTSFDLYRLFLEAGAMDILNLGVDPGSPSD